MDTGNPSRLGPVEKLKKEDRKVALLVFLVFVALTLWVCLLPQEYKRSSALSHSTAQGTVLEAGKDARTAESSGSTELVPEEPGSDPDDLPSDFPR